MKNIMLGAAIVSGTLVMASPAAAVVGCLGPNITPTATQCFTMDKNVLNATNAADVKTQLATNFSFNWIGGFNAAFKLDTLPNSAQVNFTQPLYGTTIIGVHFGGSSSLGNTTAFYKFDAGTNLDIIGLNITPGSDAYLFSTRAPGAVPEPATWAMMLLGFGLAGAVLRRRDRNVAILA